MDIKPGVRLRGLAPELIIALMVIKPLLEEAGQRMTITSALDGQHSKNSKHYLGYAVDLRNRELTEHKSKLVCKRAQGYLGAEYYLLSEDDHIHIQFNGSVTI